MKTGGHCRYKDTDFFERMWTIPAESVTAEGFAALERDYLVTYDPNNRAYTLRKPSTGRIVITNYDPATLSEAERIRWHETANQRPVNDVTFDIRADHYGGEWSLHGDFRLRSFNAMLNFLGRSVDEEPEHHVEKDDRTPPVLENPVKTMDLLVQDSAPAGSDLSVRSHGAFTMRSICWGHKPAGIEKHSSSCPSSSK